MKDKVKWGHAKEEEIGQDTPVFMLLENQSVVEVEREGRDYVEVARCRCQHRRREIASRHNGNLQVPLLETHLPNQDILSSLDEEKAEEKEADEQWKRE